MYEKDSNIIKAFNNSLFGEIRILEIEGKIYFIGKDVAKALGYSIPSKAVNTHCKGVSKMEVPTKGGTQEMLVITEGDLYRLIIKSKLESAERFEEWVFDEVLPQIRMSGGYIPVKQEESDLETLARALRIVDNTLKDKEKIIENQNKTIKSKDREIKKINKENKQLKDEIETNESWIEVTKILKSDETAMNIGDFSKLLSSVGIEIGRNQLFNWMKENKYICKVYNRYSPIQRYLKNGYLLYQDEFIDYNSRTIVNYHILVTQKGKIHIAKRLFEEKLKNKLNNQ